MNRFMFVAPRIVSTTNGGCGWVYESDCEIWHSRLAAQSHGFAKLQCDDFLVAEVEVLPMSATIKRVVALYNLSTHPCGHKKRDDSAELFRVNEEFGWNR